MPRRRSPLPRHHLTRTQRRRLRAARASLPPMQPAWPTPEQLAAEKAAYHAQMRDLFVQAMQEEEAEAAIGLDGIDRVPISPPVRIRISG